jgi:hypothetical protein
MKLTLFALASMAALALAAPTAIVQKRADYCDQWGSQVTGPYTIYNVSKRLQYMYVLYMLMDIEPLG